MKTFDGFDSRIPLPETPEEGTDRHLEGPKWLPRRAGHTGLKFANGLEMSHNEASRATEDYTCPLAASFSHEGAEIRTDGSISPKAILAFLGAKRPRWAMTGQPLRFSNGTAVSHSDESRALAAYANAVYKGRRTVKGLTAVFIGTDGQKVEGIQPNRAKLARLFKSTK